MTPDHPGGQPTGQQQDVQGISEQVLYNLRHRRGYNPQASQQHLAAGSTSGPRYQDLARLEVPALIIHGTSDPFIPIAHGRKCAQSIPGAQILWIEGMGHDIPEVFADTILDKMFEHFQRAERGSGGKPASRPIPHESYSAFSADYAIPIRSRFR